MNRRAKVVMDEKYFPAKVEEKWQRRWEESRAFEAVRGAAVEKHFYCLETPASPSGSLHMEHVRNHCVGDALAWFKRLRGFNVLHPVSWDGFGPPDRQPAEAAVRGVT